MAIWKCLEETYKVYNTSSLLLLIFKLSTIQMNEGKNIIIYIRKLEETTKQLSSIVEKVFDMCFVIISLKNLLESYHTLVVLLGIELSTKLILTMVKAQLLQ